MPNSGLDVMIDTDNFDDLGRLYSLFTTVEEGSQCLRRALKQSISQRGGEINRASLELEPGETINIVDEPGVQTEKEKGKAKSRPPNGAAQTLSLAVKWVQDVLDLKDKLDQIWKRSFQSCRDLESGINEVRRFCYFNSSFISTLSRHLNRSSILTQRPQNTCPCLSTKT
jgi:cullin 3